MNSDAIKEFFLRNGEKIAYGFLVLLSGFLIYTGINKPNILEKFQPEAMAQKATQVKNSIDDDHWKEINEEASRLPDFNIVERTNKSMSEVEATGYKLPVPWEGKSVDLSLKRSDPKVPAPVELLARGVVATIAYKTSGEYPLSQFEPAGELEKEEKPVPKLPTRRGRGSAMMGDGGSDAGMMDPEMMGRGGAGAYSGSRSRSMMSGREMMMPGREMMDAGMTSASVRRIDPLIFDLGARPTVTATEEVKPFVSRFIAGVALMPNKKIFAAFEEALAQADGYDLKRDQPFYLGLELQRLDVTDKPVDQQDESAWVLRANTQFYNQVITTFWPSFAPEVVSFKYRDDRLTTLIPPVLLDHYSWFATHPKIPLGDELQLPPGAQSMTTKKKKDAVEEVVMPDLNSSDILSTPGRPTGPEYGQGNGSSGDMMNYGRMGGGMNGQQQVFEQPEYKLIRFYDFADFPTDKFAPKEGRRYVYRVRIAVEDPNFPSNRLADPRSSTLSAEVYRRVDKLKQQDAEHLKTNKNATRLSGIYSEYSEPSNPASLPSMNEAYAGSVNPGMIKTYQVNNNSIEFNSKPPTAKVVVARFEPALGVRVPIFSANALRGTVFDKQGSFDVPDPISLEVKKTPDTTQVITGKVLVDMTGGKPLKISTSEGQTEPGMLLMFDPAGGLQVVEEVDTQLKYRLYSFAKDRGEE